MHDLDYTVQFTIGKAARKDAARRFFPAFLGNVLWDKNPFKNIDLSVFRMICAKPDCGPATRSFE
ncbi:hypothetical protein [Stenotrophomonas acidaminiphila]